MRTSRRDLLQAAGVGLAISLSGCNSITDSQPTTTVDYTLTDTRLYLITGETPEVDCTPTTGGQLVGFEHIEGPAFPTDDLFLSYHDSKEVHWFSDCPGISESFESGDTLVFDTPSGHVATFGYEPTPEERGWTELGVIPQNTATGTTSK